MGDNSDINERELVGEEEEIWGRINQDETMEVEEKPDTKKIVKRNAIGKKDLDLLKNRIGPAVFVIFLTFYKAILAFGGRFLLRNQNKSNFG